MPKRIVAAAVRRSVEAAKRQFLEGFEAELRGEDEAKPAREGQRPEAR